MKKLLVIFLMSCANLMATITVTVLPALGPSFSLSPSYAAWIPNAFTSLTAGGGDVGGDFDLTPTAFNPIGPFTFADITVADDINNWRGVASPPVPFAGEYGAYLYYAIRVFDDAGFTLDNVVINITSTDAGNLFGTSIGGPYNLSGFCTSADLFMFDTGGQLSSGVCPTDTDVLTELLYTGPAFWNFVAAPADQAALDAGVANFAAVGPFTGNALVGAFGGSGPALGLGSASVAAVPEPATMALTGLGLVGVGLLARKFRR